MKKKSPSKIRYEASHPLTSFRSTIKEKTQIELMVEKEGKSVSEIVREILLNGYADFTNTYYEAYDAGNQEGIKTGYEKGKKDWGIKIPCPVCNKDDIYMIPNDAWHKFITEYVKKCGWGHVNCHEK